MFVIVKRDGAEWQHMWKAFEPDVEEMNPNSGEVWQYMGTVQTASGWMHEFRHRDHPKTGKYEYRRVPASSNFQPKGQ